LNRPFLIWSSVPFLCIDLPLLHFTIVCQYWFRPYLHWKQAC